VTTEAAALAPGDAPARRPAWRNPWLWGALLGMAIVTLLRPVLRQVPEPPPPGEALPAVRLEGPGGPLVVPDDLTGRVHVVALVEAECPAGTCPRVLAAVAALARRQAEAAVASDVLLLAVGDGDAAGAVAAAAARLRADPARVRALSGSDPAGCAVARAALAGLAGGRAVSCAELGSLAHAARVALVDDRGRLRGLYATSDLGLDEAHHRAVHVARSAGLAPEAPAPP